MSDHVGRTCNWLIAGPVIAAAILGATTAASAGNEPRNDFRPATYDWQGVYIGVLFGLESFRSRYDDLTGTPDSVKAHGRLAGVVAGYNFRRGNLVFGPEADISYGVLEATSDADDVKSDILATVRARLGYRYRHALPYLTAGLALQQIDYSAYDIPDRLENWHAAAAAGAGIEIALGRALSARIEYLHIHGLRFVDDTADTRNHIVRAAATYHFGK